MVSHSSNVIQRVLGNEGEIADVGDGKGETRWGQTREWCMTWGLPFPADLPTAVRNYETWLRLTRLSVLGDDFLAFVVVDWAVHSGHLKPIKVMQALLNLTADGIIGHFTKQALATANRKQLAANVIAARLGFLGQLVKSRPSDSRYIHGWMKRMGRQVKELGQLP